MIKKHIHFRRLLQVPAKTFFLFGPRGTGKSTWVKNVLRPTVEIDLLRSDVFYRLKANPHDLANILAQCSQSEWILIDEIQRIPDLLNEVHALYEAKKLNFALTGSSARKLKKANANLLGGRALSCKMFPLALREIQDDSLLKSVLDFGTLPYVINEPEIAADTLASYVEVYLKEEIAAEALTRSLESFARFLQAAAQHHAQILNVEALAKRSMVKRRSVDSYFQILEDTLIGSRIPALKLGMRSKESAHQKFYFFDAGVSRAASGWIRETMDDIWRGFSLETLILNELRAYNSYMKKDKSIFHYSVTGSFDIDFIVEIEKKILNRPAKYVAIEVKMAKHWRPEWSLPLKEYSNDPRSGISKAVGVYLGETKKNKDGIDLLHVSDFCKNLWRGDFF